MLNYNKLQSDITCLVESNIIGHSWLTHLDFFISGNNALTKEEDEADNNNDDTDIPFKPPMLNDFTSTGSELDEFTECFSFGQYLNFSMVAEPTLPTRNLYVYILICLYFNMFIF